MVLPAEGARRLTIDEVIGVVASVVHTVLLMMVGDSVVHTVLLVLVEDSVVHTGEKLETFNNGGNASPF